MSMPCRGSLPCRCPRHASAHAHAGASAHAMPVPAPTRRAMPRRATPCRCRGRGRCRGSQAVAPSAGCTRPAQGPRQGLAGGDQLSQCRPAEGNDDPHEPPSSTRALCKPRGAALPRPCRSLPAAGRSPAGWALTHGGGGVGVTLPGTRRPLRCLPQPRGTGLWVFAGSRVAPQPRPGVELVPCIPRRRGSVPRLELEVIDPARLQP